VDSRIIHFDAPTGLSDNQVNQTKFMISPNPSDGLFTLHVSSADEQAFIISVKDVTCKEVLKKYCPFNSELKETVNLAGSPKGIYFVHFQNDHFSEIRKVIIK
jgi:hypothetical protein